MLTVASFLNISVGVVISYKDCNLIFNLPVPFIFNLTCAICDFLECGMEGVGISLITEIPE